MYSSPISHFQYTYSAAVPRLLHHAHVVLTEGASHRLAQATAGHGVTPLT